MSIKLMNSGDIAETVQVRTPSGTKEEVQLQPKGKLTLPLGYSLDSGYAGSTRARVFANGQPINKFKGA